MREKEIKGISGWLMLILLVAVLAAAVAWLVWAIQVESVAPILASSGVLLIDIACGCGFTVVNPNQAKVIQLFGVYKGTIKRQGLWWVNPLTRRRQVTLRIRNFESSKLR